MSDTNNEINIHYPANIFPLNSNIINTDLIEKKNNHSSPEIRPKNDNALSNANSLFYTSKSVIKDKSYSSSYSNTLFHFANDGKNCDKDSSSDNNISDLINNSRLNNRMKDLTENNEDKTNGSESEEENILKELEQLKKREKILKARLKEIQKLNKKKAILFRKEKAQLEKGDEIHEDKKEKKEKKKNDKEEED